MEKIVKETEWSVSRIKSYMSCQLQYDLNYNKKIKSDWNSPESTKGTAFHYIAENYKDFKDRTFSEWVEHMTNNPIKWGQKINMSQVNLVELETAFKNLKVFWKDFVESTENGFTKIITESKINFRVDNNLFQSYLDLILINENTKEYVVIDYKTSKSKSGDHELQLSAYIRAVWNHYEPETPLQDFLKRIKAYLYFPYVSSSRGTLNDLVLQNINHRSTIETMSEVLTSSIDAIAEEKEWKPNISFACGFCAYQGTDYCPLSKEKGFHKIRGLTFKQST